MASSGSSYISRRRDKFDSQVHQGNQPYRSNNLHKVDPTLRETFNPDVEESNARSLLQNHTSRDMDPEKTRGSSYSEMDMNDLMGGGLQGGFLKYPIVFIIILYGIGWAAYASMEEWGFVRCIYFITTTITAVGYGDVVPTSQGARFFTTVFAPIGIFLVLLIINTSVLRLYLRAEKRMRKRVTIKGRLTFVALQLADVIFWLFIFSLFLFIGAVIYYVGRGSGDGEHWTYIDALYFCMITITAVGYGDLYPTGQGLEFFTVCYIICSLTVAIITFEKIGLIMFEVRVINRLKIIETSKVSPAMIRHLGHEGKITALDFLVGMQTVHNIVDKERDIDPILRRFRELDMDKNGVIDIQDEKAAVEVARSIGLGSTEHSEAPLSMRSVIAETWDILKLQFNERQRQIARLTATSRPSTMTGNAPGGGGGAGAGVIPPTSGTAGTTDFSSTTAYTPPTVGDLDSARNPLRPSEEL